MNCPAVPSGQHKSEGKGHYRGQLPGSEEALLCFSVPSSTTQATLVVGAADTARITAREMNDTEKCPPSVLRS